MAWRKGTGTGGNTKDYETTPPPTEPPDSSPPHDCDATAASGSYSDIQAAVNIVDGLGGGNVCIPAGTFNFDSVGNWHKVTVPAGVNIFGASNSRSSGQNTTWNTVLVQPWDVPSGDLNAGYKSWFDISGAAPTQVSDLKLKGYAKTLPTTLYYLTGIDFDSTVDLRVDHIYFENIRGHAVGIGTTVANDACCGVIDHCYIINTDDPYPGYGDNPYDAHLNGYANRTVDYGVQAGGNGHNTDVMWDHDITNVLGHYTNNTLFIEDCVLSQWRHCVSSIDGYSFVFRHNTLYGDNQGSVDGHGTYSHIGTRSMEIYENNFYEDNALYEAQPNTVNIRGGGGVYFNNTLANLPPNGIDWYFQLMTTNEGAGTFPDGVPGSADCPWYEWNNTAMGTMEIGLNIVNHGVRPGYTSYTYPHPLVT